MPDGPSSGSLRPGPLRADAVRQGGDPAAAAGRWRDGADRQAQLRRLPETLARTRSKGGAMNTRRAWTLAVGAAITSLALPLKAEYPDKPMKLIVPWPPGGVTDTLARFTADQPGRSISQPVVVENKAGANGIIGTQAAMALPPDGYGLLAVTAETHAINPSVYKPLQYDPIKDFEPVAMVARVSFVLATRADLPPNSGKELVAHANANPGKVSGASCGVGR